MDSLLAELSAHGYPLLIVLVLLETFGLPVPAAIALFVAGAAAGRGVLHVPEVLACGIGAMLLGDTVMYHLGRLTGWWLLGILCRLSLNPESCILRSADAFFKRGRTLLLFAKFVPGINTLAPVMAGSMNMRYWLFVRYDSGGTALYISTYVFLGVLLSGVLEAVAKGYQNFDRAFRFLLIAAVLLYLGVLVWRWYKGRALRAAPKIDVQQAATDLAASRAIVYDVRSHGYYDADAVRIQGSRRLDPNAFHQWEDQVPRDVPLYLYCTCIREATSARIALMLLARGVECRVLRGGLRKWKEAGLPLEQVPKDEVSALPVFG